MLERARRLAEEQYLADAYRPTEPETPLNATALRAQTSKTRRDVHPVAQEVGARLATPNPLAGLAGGPKLMATDAAAGRGLTEAEILAVMVYTSDDYAYINAATANDKKLIEQREFSGQSEDYLASDEGRKVMKRFFEEGSLHSAMAIAALEKLPVQTGTCFRGSRMTPAAFEQQYGDPLNKKLASTTLSNLTSCSRVKDNADVFANRGSRQATVSVMTEIEVTHGRDISALSIHGYEEEWLLLPGTVLQTISWEDTKWGDGEPAATRWVYVKAKEG